MLVQIRSVIILFIHKHLLNNPQAGLCFHIIINFLMSFTNICKCPLLRNAKYLLRINKQIGILRSFINKWISAESLFRQLASKLINVIVLPQDVFKLPNNQLLLKVWNS